MHFLTPYNRHIMAMLAAMCLCASIPAVAQTEYPLDATAVAAWAAYGSVLAISGDLAVVGAPFDGEDGSGSVHVFRYDGERWVEEQKLTASDAAGLDTFGSSVAVTGNVIVVGAPLAPEGDADGSAYAFRYDGEQWVEEHRWTNVGHAFGSAVAVSGDLAFIGASRVVHVFRYEGESWVAHQVLQGSDLPAGAGWQGSRGFGTYSMALEGNVLVVGAPHDDMTGRDGGSAYVFRRDGDQWVEEQKLTTTYMGLRQFGRDVGVHADVIVVGAPFDDASGGSAHVFRHENGVWTEEQRLRADLASTAHFGYSVAISEATIAVSAEDTALRPGGVYLFRYEGGEWVELQTLRPSAIPNVDLRYSAAISEGFVLAGATALSPDTAVPGTVSAFHFEGTTSTEDTGSTPEPLILTPPFPNPSSSLATMQFALRDAGPATLTVYDLLGREVAVLFEGTATAGWDEAAIDVSGLAPGVYLARLSAGGVQVTRRLTVVR